MYALKFADSHNMIAFLAKPIESEGFEKIVDLLNANPIKYALSVDPTIYTLCIKQFWATAKVKTINGEVQLQALVDGKKVIITETRRGFLATVNAVIDCKMAKIAIGVGITRSVFSVKGIDLGEEEAPYWTNSRKRESYKPRPSTDEIGAKPSYYARKDFLDCHLPRDGKFLEMPSLILSRIP
ncbi:hypothetical protein Tco_0929223 [Tanacetum coccineum]